MILLVKLEMLRELSEPSGEQSHLDLGRTGVLVVVLVSVDGISLGLSRDQLLFLWLYACSDLVIKLSPARIRAAGNIPEAQ
jgi:hypothetical protein